MSETTLPCAATAADAAQPPASAATPAPTAEEKLREVLVAQGRLDESAAEEALEVPAGEDFEFAGNVAEQVGGADLSDERGQVKRDKERAMEEAARVNDWKAKLAGMSFEERVSATLECFSRRRSNATIERDLLEFCREERTVEEAEAHVSENERFESNGMSAHQYLFFMQRTGALDEREYDSDGVLITDEMRDELRELGAPEEEIEDLAVDWRVATTDVGDEALKRDDPLQKGKDLIARKLSRRATYRRVLGFCQEPHSMEEIFQLLQGDPGLEVNAQGVMGCQPSAYVSHLEDAGILAWNGKWHLTKAGELLLKTMS